MKCPKNLIDFTDIDSYGTAWKHWRWTILQVVTLSLREPTVSDSKSLWRPKPPLLKWPSFPPLNISAASRKGQSRYMASITGKAQCPQFGSMVLMTLVFMYHGIYSTWQSNLHTCPIQQNSSASVYWTCFAIYFDIQNMSEWLRWNSKPIQFFITLF